MLRRCIRDIASSRSVERRHKLSKAQRTPFFLSSRNDYATASAKKLSQMPPLPPSPPPPPPPQESSNSGSSLKKLAIGSVVIGGALLTAYQTGYIGPIVKDEKSLSNNNLEAISSPKRKEDSSDHATLPSVHIPSDLKPNSENVEKSELPDIKDLDVNQETSSESDIVKESELAKLIEEITPVLDEQIAKSEGKISLDSEARFDLEENKQPESPVENNVNDNSIQVFEESATMEASSHQDASIELPKAPIDLEIEARPSLAYSYSLVSDEYSHEEGAKSDATASILNEKEVNDESGILKKKIKDEDEKVVLDFLEAIHTAEKRQAETDAYVFAEEKRRLKEKYEKELKDARARELRYAEEAAHLEKELNKEKLKAVAAVKSLQEKAEQKLHEELLHKEEEADIQLKKAQELAKAELAAAIASEKASQIEKFSEADTNINALCMAFYARSEEARQTHSVHKLALGTLALEDALSKGLPIRAEVDALHKSLEGIDKDSLIDLVLSSLPEEALNNGTDTHMQLNQKFNSLKGTLRHFSLIPAGGGGLLTHAVAHVASSIKMKDDRSGDGIESVISIVENFLIQGKFAEAADTLEEGVHGTEAEQVVVDFTKQARNRAIVEQALSLLQSYATSITFS